MWQLLPRKLVWVHGTRLFWGVALFLNLDGLFQPMTLRSRYICNHLCMDSTIFFSTIKSASASIAFFHKIIFLPTTLRGHPKFVWWEQQRLESMGCHQNELRSLFFFQLVDFALLYGIHNQGYCYLVVATMATLFFGDMCRYSDVSQLK